MRIGRFKLCTEKTSTIKECVICDCKIIYWSIEFRLVECWYGYSFSIDKVWRCSSCYSDGLKFSIVASYLNRKGMKWDKEVIQKISRNKNK